MGHKPLGNKDLRRLLDTVQQLYALHDHASFTTCLVDSLASLVPVDIASYDELNPKTKKTFVKTAPHDYPMPTNGCEVLGKFLLQHPCVAYAHRTGDGAPRKITDFISVNQWKRTSLFNEFYRHLGTVHNLGMQMATGSDRSTMVTMGFHSAGRDFDERDRSILAVLRPHLAQAYSNAQVVTEIREGIAKYKSLMELMDQAVIELSPTETIRWATVGAIRLLTPPGTRTFSELHCLPEVLVQWLQRQDTVVQDERLLSTPLRPLDFVLYGRPLRARLLRNGDSKVIALELRTREISSCALAPLGLSNRESEILSWLAQGKANADIAMILHISVRTVHKHVEKIYQKLGVDNRHAAMAIALDLIQV